MTDEAIFKATFVDVRNIKTRKVCQFVFEVAQEQANHALECLGGLPRSDIDTWVAVARIQMPGKAPEPKKKWHEMKPSQRAGIRCSDPEFIKWLGVANSDEAAIKVREICGILSRSELDDHLSAEERWNNLDWRFSQEIGKMAEER